MRLVTEFYENAPIDWAATERHQAMSQKLQDLKYSWRQYQENKEQIERMWADDTYHDYSAIKAAEDDNQYRAEKMLKDVAEIRPYLWYS
jgi:hypothetical protein